jgi:hypothetical protein
MLWPVKVCNLDVSSKVLKVALDFDLQIPLEDSEISLSFDDLDPSTDLYFKGDEKEILFKSEGGEFFIYEDQINIPIPQIAFFKEYRSHPRLDLEEPMSLAFKTLKENKDNFQILMDCHNIGRGGIGASIAAGHAHLFHKGDCLFLERMGDIRLKEPLEVQIVYKRQVKSDEKTSILVGLKFKEEISEDFLNSLKNE